jgi:hypothetical protein
MAAIAVVAENLPDALFSSRQNTIITAANAAKLAPSTNPAPIPEACDKAAATAPSAGSPAAFQADQQTDPERHGKS